MNGVINNRRRDYRNQKLQKKNYSNSINLFQNKIHDFSQGNMSHNPNKSEIFTKINIQNNIRNNYDRRKENNIQNSSKDFYHKKNYYSKGLSSYNPTNNSYHNLTNINTEHKNYQKYNTKYNMFATSLKKDTNSRDSSMNDFQKKYRTSIKLNNNSNSRKCANTSYDFKKLKYNVPNTNEEKRIPVIVVTKKPKNKTSINFFIKRKSIIKIQSAWRGYFLRKIAVGSIKKYIGFIALIKYLEKVFYNNIEYLYYEFIFLLKKSKDKTKTNFIYKKINNKDNLNKKIRYRNKMNLHDNNSNDSSGNILGYSAIKTNLFKSQDFELERDKSESNITDRDRVKGTNYKDNIEASHNLATKEKDIKEKDKNIKKMIYNRYKNPLNNVNNNNPNIIYKHKKITYVPKKLIRYKTSLNNNFNKNSKGYKIKKLINIIKKNCYFRYYPLILYKLKILQKLNLIKYRLKSLSDIIKFFENKNLKKKYMKKYRDHIIILKVQEEIFKENNNKIIDSFNNNTDQEKKGRNDIDNNIGNKTKKNNIELNKNENKPISSDKIPKEDNTKKEIGILINKEKEENKRR